MADRELKFIYKEPEPAKSSCLEMALCIVGIVIIFGFVMGGLLR